MYTLPRYNYRYRGSIPYNPISLPLVVPTYAQLSHHDRVLKELKGLGVSTFELGRAESGYAPNVIHADEHIGGVLYGHHKDGHVMMIATDRRVIFLDKKPMFVNKDEITYDVVSGISLNKAGIGSTVTLHTRIKDYVIRTFNEKCAEGFVRYIESRSLEHTPNRDRWEEWQHN